MTAKYDSAAQHIEKSNVTHLEVVADPELLSGACIAENREHEQSLWHAAKKHRKVCFWAAMMTFTIVMESYCSYLTGKIVALPYFQKRYGVEIGLNAEGVMRYAIETKWQSSLHQAGQCGAFVGALLAGPVTNKLGYRWTTLLAVFTMNAAIFISFFADSLEVLVISQAFEGIPWGFFIANSPAYVSEIVPLKLRAACASTIQTCWSLGGIIAGAVCYANNQRDDQWSWRLAMALQWMFPVPLLAVLFFAPESPYWLIRHGRSEEALRSIKRLGHDLDQEASETLAMMERTIEIEVHEIGDPPILDLFKGVDLRRTVIISLVYASHNFAGNMITTQAVFFFEQAGLSTNFSFQLGLINSSLGFIATLLSIPLGARFDRRKIFLAGCLINTIFLILIGASASVPQNTATSYAQAIGAVLITFVYTGSLGPISYSIIAETSSVRLRALSTGVGRAAYYITEIPMIYLASRLLNPTGWNLAGKSAFVWAGTAMVCFVAAHVGLPEMKGRSYRELDILFGRKTPARRFKETVIDIKDNE